MSQTKHGLLVGQDELVLLEKLIAEVSARFVNIAHQEVDREINGTLKRVQELFELDRCGLLEVSPDKKLVRVSHAVYAEGVEQVSGDVNLVDLFPWSYEKLVVQKRHIAVSRLEDLPEEAQQDRESHVALRNYASLNIPLVVGGKVSHIFSMNVLREHYIWWENLIPRFRQLGEVLANSLEHRRKELELEEQRQFDMLLAEISTVFINLPAGEVDREIENAQRRVCECLGLDMSGLWQRSADNLGLFMLTHLYRPLGGPPTPERMDGQGYFPWCQEQILSGKMVAISTEDLPAEAARDQGKGSLSEIQGYGA